ncbi:MAG TPA: LytTR family DNA-binding domain-containing protein [Niabella sp.]|nr:LytTR family DNA-binding domain-containing protein [Niabella sp.]HQW13463.1 LytTR family DNA-binding domain-containing protein [Niabella sp.]HQX18857.1 LytTR family DNA-binding domain-containing protein [Niabella sp.]HQX41937.1 LytTR family DNA-binding domain-containing protein [Niabella sp.]HRB27151.1 LytTR family DNA-binding domain-containing protein [Niabella sp.]
MPHQLKCLIIDDNKVARVLLTKILSNIEGITIAAEMDDALHAKSYLDNNEIDLLFLDIEMPGMSGLELLRMLDKRPLTILTTAKQGYAVEAFELNVVDYIVKPFSLARIMLSVERAKELLKNKNVQISQESSQNFLFVKDNKTIRKIDLNDILWVEAKGDYIQITDINKNYIIHSSLRAIEDRFNSQKFLRVHRSYIIAMDKIDYIEDRIVYIHNQAIPISESYRDILLQKLHLL